MFKKVLVLLATILLINSTYANPEGGVVSAGSASITSPNASTVQINQSSDKAIINWNSFNISSDETTRFVQPNAGSIALNRINPQQGASQIFGQLQANGQIILVNQAGIYFGPGSRVDVAGIIASTTDITDENFLAGYYKFDQKSSLYNGSIINRGTIIAADNGLIALIGSAVSNSGMIQAHLGNVVLASGNKFTVGFDDTGLLNFTVDEATTTAGVNRHGKALTNAVSNSGTIIADGGTILMTAKATQGVMDNVINMTGVAQARSVEEKNGEIILAGDDEGTTHVSGTLDASGINVGETGGIVQVLGNYITIDSSAVINVNGDIGGGQINIGGSQRGQGPLQNATTTYVASGANLLASAITQGNGGNIVVWGNEATGFEGNIIATGGANGGNGGNAETSVGPGDTSGQFYLNVDQARIDLSSPAGKTGTWLLDPTDVTLSTAALSNETFSGGVYTPTGTTANILISGLVTNLGSGNVNVITTSAGGGAGMITVGNLVSWATANTLTLTAGTSITINAPIQNTSTGGITLNAGTFITLNSILQTTTGNISLTAANTSPITFASGSGVTTAATSAANGVQNYSAASYLIGTGASITLTTGATAGDGAINFANPSVTPATIDGAGNLTLTSGGTANLGFGLVGINTPLTTFTANGTGTLTNTGNTILNVDTTGNQIYNMKISAPSATSFVGMTSTGGTVTINNTITAPGELFLTNIPGGVFLNSSNINMDSVAFGSGGTVIPLTLTGNSVITTAGTGSAINNFGGAVSGAFSLTLNQTSGMTNTFDSTVNIASLTVNTGGTTAFNGGNVTTSGTQIYNNAVTIGTTPVTLQASGISLGAASSITAGANNLSLITNALVLNNAASTISGTGSFTITPLTATTSIGLNGGAGTLAIDATKLATTFSGVTIGTSGTSTGALTIGAAANFGSETVSMNAGSYVDTGALVITAGTLNLKANSAAGAIGAVANNVGVSATNLTLNTSNGSAFINSTGGIALGTSTLGTGLINLTTAGAITQTGIITDSGANIFTAGAFSIALTQNNVFTGSVSVNNSGANNVSVVNNGSLSMAASNLGTGTLNLTSTGLTQTAAIKQTAGAGAVTINANGGVITLSNASNVFTGTVNLSNSGANAVNLTNINTTPLSLGNVSVGSGALTLVGLGVSQIGGSSITQTGAGAVTITANAGAINLASTTNSFLGAVALSNSGANNVNLVNSTALNMGTTSVGTGTLSLTGVGITQASTITQATGASTATFNGGAGAITLNSANTLRGAVTLNNSGANDVSLTDNMALIMGTSTVGQNLTLSAKGSITETGVLTVPGATTLGVTTADIRYFTRNTS